MPQWTFQTGTLGNFETTSLLRDNVLYVTGPQNVAWAIDARTGRQIWRYRRELPDGPDRVLRPGQPRLRRARRQAVHDHARRAPARARHEDRRRRLGRDAGGLQDRLRRRRSRRSSSRTRSSSASPAASTASAASSTPTTRRPASGRGASTPFPGPASRATTPGPAIRGRRGGAGVWVTGAYDPEQNLLFYGTGNPGPDYHSDEPRGRQPLQRLAGRARRRHRQAALALPVHAARRARLGRDRGAGPRRPDDRRPAAQGRDVRQPQRLLLHARSHHRQGDRRQAVRHDDVGQGDRRATAGRCCCRATRPTRRARSPVPTSPAAPTSGRRRYDPTTRTVLRQRARSLHDATTPGSRSTSPASASPAARASGSGTRTARPIGALRAIDPATGERKWEFKYLTPSTAGVLTTASGLIFSGDGDGNLLALDSRTGKAAVALPDGRRRCTARRRSPTCSTAASTCWCPRARR